VVASISSFTFYEIALTFLVSDHVSDKLLNVGNLMALMEKSGNRQQISGILFAIIYSSTF